MSDDSPKSLGKYQAAKEIGRVSNDRRDVSRKKVKIGVLPFLVSRQ